MRRRTNLEREYFEWLIGTKINIIKKKDWTPLLSWLFDQEFVPIVPHDENRAVDGVDLRQEFFLYRYEHHLYVIGEDKEELDKNCNMLEFLIGLAIRMGYYLYGYEYGDNDQSKWFWLFIENLKFDKRDRQRNNEILERFLNRTYNRDGSGGIFPLEHPPADQRKIELWYQMNQYIEEKYG